MQKYEIMAIIENSLDAKAAEKYAETSISDRITKEFGGKITFNDFWGERGFAYIINKQKWGYYSVMQFDMDPENTQELRHELNLDGKIVRFMISKVDPRSGTPKEYADLKAEYEAQEKKKSADKAKKAEKKATPGRKEKLTTVKAAPAPTEAPKATEAPKDDVDKKLDAIIDESAGDL